MHDTRLLLQCIPLSNPLFHLLESLFLFLWGQLFLRRDIETKFESWSLSNTLQPGFEVGELVNGFNTNGRPVLAPDCVKKISRLCRLEVKSEVPCPGVDICNSELAAT